MRMTEAERRRRDGSKSLGSLRRQLTGKLAELEVIRRRLESCFRLASVEWQELFVLPLEQDHVRVAGEVDLLRSEVSRREEADVRWRERWRSGMEDDRRFAFA
jgi:hypothetical protein